MRVIAPYLTLAERLGGTVVGLADGPIESVEVTYNGEITEVNTGLLTTAVIKGILNPVMENEVNYVNAPGLAKERGINLETAAEAYGNHVDMLPDFDLVVLAPQAASYLADLQKDCERVGNKCVACRGKQYIELSQNGDKSLAFVSEQLSK
jgi:cellobiose-specific phosphotransferase system component IIB